MKITRDNYEVFLIDYLDDNLVEKDKSEVEQFLVMNPDIKKEFEGIDQMQLSDEPIEFPLKEKLHYTKEGFSETDYLCIGQLEGDLNQEESVQFETLKKNVPELEQEIKLFGLTKLKPKLSIIFPDKAKLKQRTIRPMFWAYSAAASIVAVALLTVGLWTNNQSTDQLSDNSAKRNEVARKVEKTGTKTNEKQNEGKKVETIGNKLVASNVDPVSTNKDQSVETFDMEFEEVELQIDEMPELASVQVRLPTGYLMQRSKVKAFVGENNEVHQLSNQLIKENKAYIEYWSKIYAIQ